MPLSRPNIVGLLNNMHIFLPCIVRTCILLICIGTSHLSRHTIWSQLGPTWSYVLATDYSVCLVNASHTFLVLSKSHLLSPLPCCGWTARPRRPVEVKLCGDPALDRVRQPPEGCWRSQVSLVTMKGWGLEDSNLQKTRKKEDVRKGRDMGGVGNQWEGQGTAEADRSPGKAPGLQGLCSLPGTASHVMSVVAYYIFWLSGQICLLIKAHRMLLVFELWCLGDRDHLKRL